MIPILIADDHGVLRAGLRALLNSEPGLRVVGEAADGHEALLLAATLKPEVILADINMPGPSGIQVARELQRTQPNTRVLVLTMHDDPTLMREALQAGAAGYVVKRAVETELIAAIRAVAGGEVYVDAGLRFAFAPESRPAREQLEHEEPLTDDDCELLRHLAQGRMTRQIAELMLLDGKMVEERRAALEKKLGLHSRIELVRYARQRGLLSA